MKPARQHSRPREVVPPAVVWAAEARIFEIEEAQQSMDGYPIQRPLVLESCLDYKFTKPSMRLSRPTSLSYASLTIILKKIVGPQVSITSVAENI